MNNIKFGNEEMTGGTTRGRFIPGIFHSGSRGCATTSAALPAKFTPLFPSVSSHYELPVLRHVCDSLGIVDCVRLLAIDMQKHPLLTRISATIPACRLGGGVFGRRPYG